MKTIWSVADARAKFATLLSAARAGEPQLIRQSGLEDVQIVRAESQLNLDHLLTGRAQHDALRIVLEQYREQIEQRPAGPGSRFTMPPNLSGDVLRWVVNERGPFRAALYVVDAVRTMRETQELLDLPQTAAARVVRGLRLTAGNPDPFTPEVFDNIESLVRQIWGSHAPAVLSKDWAAARAGEPPEPTA